MAPQSLLHPLSSFCFEEKTKFSASQNLSFARSKWFALPETQSQSDVGSIKPPDFSLKLYRSVSVPQKKEKRKTHSNLTVPQPYETKRRTGVFLPEVLHEKYHSEDPPKFTTSHRPPDAQEYELTFVKTGKYPSGPYKNPKPHNFRPVSLNEDLPGIVTTYERDPVRTTRCQSDFNSRSTKTKMDTYKPAEPRWDARLILPQPLWPPKSASYSRHRRRRGAYSAFLDRVEEKLSRSWKNC
ncbi:uncharacterized protein si:dkey-30e9.6 [Micropterus salmoides]|uniref:uncharacterized protein si:dkey-30e9.6 n=1 Tax=Micropterus salmoides TaxID=27706 RepID=UPI0018EDEC57|nr:uncharacterized protein si:dkey-30e9.6 [Micropterus salmoides]